MRLGDWFTVFMLMDKLPPLMTAPLNKAMACCDSDLDEQVAVGFSVSWEDVLVALPDV